MPSLGKSWRGSGTSTCWLVCCSDAKEGQQQRGAQCEAVEAQRASEPRVDWRFRFLHLLEAWGRTPLQLALEQTGGPAQIRGALPIVRHRKWARPCTTRRRSPRDAVHGVLRRRERCGLKPGGNSRLVAGSGMEEGSPLNVPTKEEPPSCAALALIRCTLSSCRGLHRARDSRDNLWRVKLVDEDPEMMCSLCLAYFLYDTTGQSLQRAGKGPLFTTLRQMGLLEFY